MVLNRAFDPVRDEDTGDFAGAIDRPGVVVFIDDLLVLNGPWEEEDRGVFVLAALTRSAVIWASCRNLTR